MQYLIGDLKMGEWTEYNRVRDQNNYNRKCAQGDAQEQILDKLDLFIEKHSERDIIIDTTESNYFKLPKRYKKIDNVYFGIILIDKTEIHGEGNYDEIWGNWERETRTTGGGLTGYSVSQTSSGYSVTPEYGISSKEEVYVLHNRHIQKCLTVDTINVKAVKRGTANMVIEKETELFFTRDRYEWATEYRNDKNILDRNIHVNKKQSQLYNCLSFIEGISFLFMILLTPLCIANQFARKYLLLAMLYDFLFGQTVTLVYPTVVMTLLFYIVSIICFALMKQIKDKFLDNDGLWYDESRGKLNYHCTEKNYLKLQYATEWQDSNRFKTSKIHLIYASLLFVFIYCSFFLDLFTNLYYSQIILAIVLDIIASLWALSVFLANTPFGKLWINSCYNYEGEIFCMLAEHYVAGGKLFTGFYYMLKNPNYYRSIQFKQIITDFENNKGIENYRQTEIEVHGYTVK